MTIYYLRLLIPARLQNLKGVKMPCHSKEGRVHERHAEEEVGWMEYAFLPNKSWILSLNSVEVTVVHECTT